VIDDIAAGALIEEHPPFLAASGLGTDFAFGQFVAISNGQSDIGLFFC
jgi:hypothetical protein